jgi:hypothetical protein
MDIQIQIRGSIANLKFRNYLWKKELTIKIQYNYDDSFIRKISSKSISITVIILTMQNARGI